VFGVLSLSQFVRSIGAEIAGNIPARLEGATLQMVVGGILMQIPDIAQT
jgi:hypothetical protein